MKRTSACLAALALGLSASQGSAQSLNPAPVGADPIADLIANPTEAAKPAPGTMAPIPDDAKLIEGPPLGGLARAADWAMRVTLYHSGPGGVGTRDSLGCPVVAMRTAAVDPKIAPRRSLLFIPDTVGMAMPDGSKHDGFWYASDTGGAIKGHKIDLYTGHGRGSMKPVMRINTKTVAVLKAGTFTGCPKAGNRVA